MRPSYSQTVKKGNFRDVWTLDAWDRALDWDQARPAEAAAFLEFQEINGDFRNLNAKVLRAVGFTALYEAGRIEPVISGERASQNPDTKEILDSIRYLEKEVHGLNRMAGVLKSEICALGVDSGLRIFVKTLLGLIFIVKAEPSDLVLKVKFLIKEWGGVKPVVIF
jgi:hypothetical protein